MMLLNRESVGDKIFCYAMHTSRRILQCTLIGCKFRKGSIAVFARENQPGSASWRIAEVHMKKPLNSASGQKRTQLPVHSPGECRRILNWLLLWQG